MKKVLLTLLSFLSFFFACMEIEPTRIAVTSVILSATSIELEEGDSHVLTATVSPKDAENKTVIWTSSNVSVATVSNGIVRACKLGNAIITATTDDGGKTATCEVTVNAKNIPVESILLDRTSVELTEGEELTLTATVNPDNATDKNVIWSSSNPSVASVANGKITALMSGRATIVVSSVDGGKTANCEVTVNAKIVPVTSISLNFTSIELTEGEELTLTATINPDNATNKTVFWASSNPSVVSVVDGKITALSVGNAEIIVETEDGRKIAVCKVTVIKEGNSNESLDENEGNW